MSTDKSSTIMNELKKYEGSDNVALICGEEKLTYKQLIADAKHIARGLIADGVKKGDRVLFCMSRTLNAMRALLGILYAGGVYVAADPEWPEERLNFACKDANVVFSMTDETCKSLREKESSSVELPVVNGEDEAAIYYTSGSTGQPKGAVLHHIVFGALHRSNSKNEGYWDLYISNFKFAFVGSLMDFLNALGNGKTLVLAREKEQFSPELLGNLMKRHHVEVFHNTSSIILRFLENPSFAQAFYNLKLIILGGERLLPEVAAKFASATNGSVLCTYGSSEMLYCTEYYYRNDGKVILGKSVYGVSLYLLDENLEEIERGQEGELFIGGTPAKYGHYLNRPDLDNEKYIEHKSYGRLFCTGDYARLEVNGEITLLGRMDGMVKLHGQRIEIGEVENAITSFPGVRRAAVRLQGESPHEMLAGYYTVSEEFSEIELRRYLSNRLPYYMVPSLLMKLDAMPENANGKLNYRVLPPITVPTQEYTPPETEQEKLLCEIFAEVLKLQAPVSVNDSFLALGGDSISGIMAASKILKHGYSFDVRWLFAAPTARLLAPLLMPVTDYEEVQDEIVPELTSRQREAIEDNVGWENVECVYPVTSTMKIPLNHRNSWVMYDMLEVDALTITPEWLKLRFEELTMKHQALRSVFALADKEAGEEPAQVVLREHEPDYFSVDLRTLADGEGLSERQKAYFRSLISLDINRPKDLEREILFRVGLVRISETKNILFIAFSHLLLDGFGLAKIVRELTDPQIKVNSDRGLWRQRISRLYNTDYSQSLEYWKKLLDGCEGVTQLPVKNEKVKQKRMGMLSVSGGKKLYEQAAAYCSTHNFTIAAIMTYALGKTLMEILKLDDVCFLSAGSSMGAKDMELAGMFILHFPVRLHREDSLADFQAQLFSSAANLAFLVSSEHDIFLLSEQKNYVYLSVQNFFTDYSSKVRQIDFSEILGSLSQEDIFMQSILSIEPSNGINLDLLAFIDERLQYSGPYNTERYDPDFIKKLSQELIKQLKIIVKEG